MNYFLYILLGLLFIHSLFSFIKTRGLEKRVTLLEIRKSEKIPEVQPTQILYAKKAIQPIVTVEAPKKVTRELPHVIVDEKKIIPKLNPPIEKNVWTLSVESPLSKPYTIVVVWSNGTRDVITGSESKKTEFKLDRDGIHPEHTINTEKEHHGTTFSWSLNDFFWS